MTPNTISSWLNLAYHRIIARRLSKDDSLVDEASNVIEKWQYHNPHPVQFVVDWGELLHQPLEKMAQIIVGRNLEAQNLRETSPFALIPSTLWTEGKSNQIWRRVASRAMRILERYEYPLYADHLKKLDKTDRNARFSGFVDDQWIDSFVQGLTDDFSTMIFGHFHPDLSLDGAVQISFADRNGIRYADIGVSVVPEARHQGIGYHLMERALNTARANGAARIWSICARDNKKMVRLGHKLSCSTSIIDGSFETQLDTSPLTTGTLALELLEEFTGEWDYDIKAHKSALSVVAGSKILHRSKEREFVRLVKLASLRRTKVITEYIILFRFALVQFCATHVAIVPLLVDLGDTLTPLVVHDPDLHTYLNGLPTRGEAISFVNKVTSQQSPQNSVAA